MFLFGTCVAIPCACVCCSLFDRRGVVYCEVVFSAFVCLFFLIRWRFPLLFRYSKGSPFAGWDFLVFSSVHLALASVVSKLLFASSGIACVTTWRSTSSALLPVFVDNLLSPLLFAATVEVWRSSSVVFLIPRCLPWSLFGLF